MEDVDMTEELTAGDEEQMPIRLAFDDSAAMFRHRRELPSSRTITFLVDNSGYDIPRHDYRSSTALSDLCLNLVLHQSLWIDNTGQSIPLHESRSRRSNQLFLPDRCLKIIFLTREH